MPASDWIFAAAIGFATATLFVVGSAATAEPLRDVTKPLCSSKDADFATGMPAMSPNCHAPVADGRRDTLEISLTAARGRAQVGEFAITDAYLYNGNYAPEVWSVDPGDNILVKLENGLSGTASFRTNLHTHGFIVSPNNGPGTPKSPVGDNVYALVYAKEGRAKKASRLRLAARLQSRSGVRHHRQCCDHRRG